MHISIYIRKENLFFCIAVSNKNKKETLASTSDAAAAPPPPISRNTAERRAAAASGGGTRKERAVEDMLRLVQENRDRHDVSFRILNFV